MFNLRFFFCSSFSCLWVIVKISVLYGEDDRMFLFCHFDDVVLWVTLFCFHIYGGSSPCYNLGNMPSRNASTSSITSITYQKVNFKSKQRALSYSINDNCPFLFFRTCFDAFLPVSLLWVLPSDDMGCAVAAAFSWCVHFLYYRCPLMWGTCVPLRPHLASLACNKKTPIFSIHHPNRIIFNILLRCNMCIISTHNSLNFHKLNISIQPVPTSENRMPAPLKPLSC